VKNKRQNPLTSSSIRETCHTATFSEWHPAVAPARPAQRRIAMDIFHTWVSPVIQKPLNQFFIAMPCRPAQGRLTAHAGIPHVRGRFHPHPGSAVWVGPCSNLNITRQAGEARLADRVGSAFYM
jgi:hypothetical protein